MASANLKVTLNEDIKKVWEMITSLDNYAWRSDLSKIEVLETGKKFIEYTREGYATTFTITTFEPMTRYELWGSGYHEAKLLAVLVFDKESLSLHDVELLMNEVCSWDLCDHLCKNLIIKLRNYEDIIGTWCISKATYTKRAAFTLISSDSQMGKEC